MSRMAKMMWFLLFPIMLAVGFTPSGWAAAVEKDEFMKIQSRWVEFEKLRDLFEDDYIVARDVFLKGSATAPDFRERLSAYLKSDRWDDRLQAYICIGWLKNDQAYRKFLGRLDAEEPNVAAMQATVVGVNLLGKEYAGLAIMESLDALPLALEGVWKREQSPRWKSVVYEALLTQLQKNEFVVNIGIVLLRKLPGRDAVFRDMLNNVENGVRFLTPEIKEVRHPAPPSLIAFYRAAVASALSAAKKEGLTTGNGFEPTVDQKYMAKLVYLQEQIDQKGR